MKLLRIVLVNVILLSSAYPCADVKSITFGEIVLAIPSIEHQDNAKEFCSPFCMCACCSISYSIENISSFNSDLVSTDTPRIIQNKYLKQHFSQIWQPPKV